MHRTGGEFSLLLHIRNVTNGQIFEEEFSCPVKNASLVGKPTVGFGFGSVVSYGFLTRTYVDVFSSRMGHFFPVIFHGIFFKKRQVNHIIVARKTRINSIYSLSHFDQFLAF